MYQVLSSTNFKGVIYANLWTFILILSSCSFREVLAQRVSSLLTLAGRAVIQTLCVWSSSLCSAASHKQRLRVRDWGHGNSYCMSRYIGAWHTSMAFILPPDNRALFVSTQQTLVWEFFYSVPLLWKQENLGLCRCSSALRLHSNLQTDLMYWKWQFIHAKMNAE